MARKRLFKRVKLSYLELFLTGNDRNEEKKYSQYKHNAWAGGSLDVIDGKNGNIAVSLNVPEYFQDTKYYTSSYFCYFLFNSVTIICELLKEGCLSFFLHGFICPELLQHRIHCAYIKFGIF
jgi:hypothetical protein